MGSVSNVVSVVVGLLIASGACGCSRAPTAAEEFWGEFSARNSAWLDPPARAMHCTLIVAQPEYSSYDADGPSYVWMDKERIESWCAPGKNARLERWQLSLDPPRHSQGVRFENGVGGGEVIPPIEGRRPIQEFEWLTARTGTTFAGILHALTWHGLPDGTTVERPDAETIVLRGVGIRDDIDWQVHSAFSHPRYMLHETSSGPMGIQLPYFTEFEIQVDAKTLRPRRVVERKDAEEVVVEFAEDEWFDLDGKPAPRRVTVSWQDAQERRLKIEYEFQVRESSWLIQNAELIHPGESLCRRMRLAEAVMGPIPPETFVLPTDVELPEHSFTKLGDGERVIPFETADGLVLESKLSIPPDATEPAPVVMFLHGAGPATFDMPLDLSPGMALDLGLDYELAGYCEFWAGELTKKGVAFFRTNKRGCAQAVYRPRIRTRRAVFGKATPSVLLADYAAALAVLRSQPDIDASRIILVGESEGTVMAVRLARLSPAGIIAVALRGYAEDNTHDTIVWQGTMGPWRNVACVFDTDSDDLITEQEYSSGRESFRKYALGDKSYGDMDFNKDGKLTPVDLKAPNAAALEERLRAVRERDDDFLWKYLLNLSSAYCLEDWDRPPLHETLLTLDIPIAIYHGDYDGSVRVEGVHETAGAFRAAGKTNLTVKTYPRLNHDLGFGALIREHEYPLPMVDLLDFLQELLPDVRRSDASE